MHGNMAFIRYKYKIRLIKNTISNDRWLPTKDEP